MGKQLIDCNDNQVHQHSKYFLINTKYKVIVVIVVVILIPKDWTN